MPNYHRVHIKGSTIFITMVSYNRTPIFLNSAARTILHDAWKYTSKKFPFNTNAICLLPDHIHALITLPENDDDYPLRIKEIKRFFTRVYLSRFREVHQRTPSHYDKQESTIWQRRYWEHTIRDEQDYQNHFDYIHYNPVKHGLVNNVSAWEWSSFHQYVDQGVYDPDWGIGFETPNDQNKFGE